MSSSSCGWAQTYTFLTQFTPAISFTGLCSTAGDPRPGTSSSLPPACLCVCSHGPRPEAGPHGAARRRLGVDRLLPSPGAARGLLRRWWVGQAWGKVWGKVWGKALGQGIGARREDKVRCKAWAKAWERENAASQKRAVIGFMLKGQH